jgi:hypothetical protein
MKRYPEDDNKITSDIFTRYKIIVETEQDKQELKEAFKHIHDSRDIDNSYVIINQLMHEYLVDGSDNILVIPNLWCDRGFKPELNMPL